MGTPRRLVDVSHVVEDGMVTYKGFPAPIICDWRSREESRAIYDGAEFQIGDAHPALSIQGAGYAVASHASIVNRAREAGTVRLPGWMLATFLRELRDGYQVWTFAPT